MSDALSRQWSAVCILCMCIYAFQQCKNFENQLRLDKVTESLKVRTFLRHSVEAINSEWCISNCIQCCDTVSLASGWHLFGHRCNDVYVCAHVYVCMCDVLVMVVFVLCDLSS